MSPPITSRRQFLLNSISLTGAAVGAFAFGAPGAAGDSLSAAVGEILTPQEREQFFQDYFRRMTEPKPLTRFRTRTEWLAFRKILREKVRQAIGLSPWPDRVPLRPTITGQVEREDYVIRRVWYQVFPDIFTNGFLYVPKTHAGEKSNASARRLPAVLNPHGHWPKGAVDPVVQTRCIVLAKKGYVAFCPESTHVADLSVGLCPIGLMTWNNLRALDYLQSLEFVDPERLGCTGASGGAQQTIYLTALDDRIKVTVPAVLVSYFRRILFASEAAHCFCNHAPGIAGCTDEHEIAAIFAPRPCRFICATGDWTREFPRDEFLQIRHIYELTGGTTDCFQFDKPHNYDQESRELMYAWFNQHLLGVNDPAAAKEPPVTPERPEDLKALGAKPPALEGLEALSVCCRRNRMFQAPNVQNRTERSAYLDRLLKSTGILLGETGLETPLNVRGKGKQAAPDLVIEKVLFDSEPQVSIPGWLMRPPQASPGAAVVIVHAEGARKLLHDRGVLVRSLVNLGVVVLAIDPRMRGELKRNWYWNQVIWGRPEEGMAAHDLNTALTFLHTQAGVNPKRIGIIALGDIGRAAIFAAVLNPRWAVVALDSVGPLYADQDPNRTLPNVLRHGDLPQFAALIAPRPLWLNGAGQRFAFTQKYYQAKGNRAGPRCSDLTAPEFDEGVAPWLRQELLRKRA